MPLETANTPADIGLIGLAVMGQNLVLNIADHDYDVAVFNRTTKTMTDWIETISGEEPSADRVHGYAELADFVNAIKKPRKVILLVKSTAVLPGDRDAVDKVIDQLLPLLDRGDIIIDGGNSNWNATIRREKQLTEQGYLFIGSGVSGGEEGARFGPSLMPGGDADAYAHIEEIWKAIAAKVDPATGKEIKGASPGNPIQDGVPCTSYIGENGAGHYVKMVHNGIEYGDMQMICEGYDLMRKLLGMKATEIAEVFKDWNTGVLDSFLIEITAEVLAQKDPDTGGQLVDMILDTAGQKGTGKWTSQIALDLGAAIPTITAAVDGRFLSALKDERTRAAEILEGPSGQFKGDSQKLIDAVHEALYSAKICSYAQGMNLLSTASQEFDYNLDLSAVAKIWRAGCIIRANLLQDIANAYEQDRRLTNLLVDSYFQNELASRQEAWRFAIRTGIELGVPLPAMSASLAYYDAYRSSRLPANLVQAQRDFFGAHTFERVDKKGSFHVQWEDR